MLDEQYQNVDYKKLIFAIFQYNAEIQWQKFPLAYNREIKIRVKKKPAKYKDIKKMQ